jgi:putative tryptophan/tyrosine transport system substrate-binding protein
MKRREFITLVGGAAAAWPLASTAQRPVMPVIGCLQSGFATDATSIAAAFHAGLKESGFVEGQNVTIEYRIAEAQYDRLPALAADLVRRQVAIIVASGAVVSPMSARAATTTIPIVFLIGADPVQNGLVASVNRPGGNITGVTTFGGGELTGLMGKRLELLRELMPKARAFAMLINPNNPNHIAGKVPWQTLAHAIGISIESVSASSESDFEPAIASLAGKQVDALIVVADTLFGSYRESLNAVLAHHAMPAMFPGRDSVVAGGLIGYGAGYTDAQRLLGIYVGRILRGEKPADLPVLQPTKFDMVINLKTAKALGLTVPDSLLVQATEVIE